MIKVASEASQVLIAKVYDAGNEHILNWWDELNAQEQKSLLSIIGEIDFQLVDYLKNHCLKGSENKKIGISKPQAAKPIPLPRSVEDLEERQRLRRIGEKVISEGKVAIFMAAGIKGAYKGFTGPEALCPVGPISQKTLLQLQAEKIVGLNRRYNTEIPFFIMTSAETIDKTKEFFEENQYFTLSKRNVIVLKQPRLPLLDRRGKIVMKSHSEVAMAPNGHGGAFLLMQKPEVLERLKKEGIEYLFYFQVDNPCVQLAAPAFIGQHVEEKASISAKSVYKNNPDEQVGVFSMKGGRLSVIEYCNLSTDYRNRRDEETDQLIFNAANVSIHIFSVDFLEKIRREEFLMPYHPIEQCEVCLDREGKTVRPSEPNCKRFECYIFDIFPWSEKSILVEADRRDEFYMFREKGGKYSLEEVRYAISEKYASWLEILGLDLPRDNKGKLLGSYEISPLFALDKDEFKEKCNAASFVVGDSLYLE